MALGETLSSLSPATSSVPWGCYYCIYLVGVVLEKMLHPWLLKLEGVLESSGGLLKTLRPHPRVYALVSLGRSLTNQLSALTNSQVVLMLLVPGPPLHTNQGIV